MYPMPDHIDPAPTLEFLMTFSDGLTCLSSLTAGSEARASSNGNPVQIGVPENPWATM